MPFPLEHKPVSAAGFSLIELLIVISIMALMAGLAVPAGVSLLENSNLATSGQLVNDQVRMARQMAAARNTTVEVRMIKTDSSVVGYNAVQIWTSQFTTNALSKMAVLPKTMAISENPNHSGLLSVITATASMRIPGNSSAQYVAFDIAPSGWVTSVNTMSSLYVTVLSSRYASSSSSSLPKNFVVVQVNPSTASTTYFQP